MKYKVLLYYKFKSLTETYKIRKQHHLFCLEHNLKGRVLIADEGINGTVAGLIEDAEKYKTFLENTLGFGSIHWKEDFSETIPFAKLKTKIRKSLVNLGEADGVDIKKFGGKHLSPAEWKHTLESEKDFLLLDVRNDYEGKIGRFKNAVIPDIDTFHDFPKWIKEFESYKDKKVLMYCTGGIRCEKFSALMVKDGFKDVNQLYGGILNYHKEVGSEHYEGSCFVFDDRLVVPINTKDAPPSACECCGVACDKVLNCANMDCNKLFVCCDVCAEQKQGVCKEACLESPTCRPFDKATFRIPFRKKGVVFPELSHPKKKNSAI